VVRVGLTVLRGGLDLGTVVFRRSLRRHYYYYYYYYYLQLRLLLTTLPNLPLHTVLTVHLSTFLYLPYPTTRRSSAARVPAGDTRSEVRGDTRARTSLIARTDVIGIQGPSRAVPSGEKVIRDVDVNSSFPFALILRLDLIHEQLFST
jgi:hypothetical protein